MFASFMSWNTETEDFMQLNDDGPFAALRDFSRGAVFPGCFTRGKGNQSFVKFFKGWFTV